MSLAHGSCALRSYLEHLRGSLPAAEPGARGIEQAARNPACLRIKALLFANVDPAEASRTVYHEPVDEGQSSLALKTGKNFEHALFEHGAAQLLHLYQTHQRLSPAQSRIVIFDEVIPENAPQAMRRRRERTRQYMLQKLQRDPHAPHLILHPRFQMNILGALHDIEPDGLVASDSDPFYTPLEIKSHAQYLSNVDQAALCNALRQAAVVVESIRACLADLGVASPATVLPAHFDLILKDGRTERATLHPKVIDTECESLQLLLHDAPGDVQRIVHALASYGPSATLAQASVLESIPNHYHSICRSFCPLRAHCKQQARLQADSMLLGTNASHEFSPVHSDLQRAWALLHNQEPPQTHEEELFIDHLQAAFSLYHHVRSSL